MNHGCPSSATLTIWFILESFISSSYPLWSFSIPFIAYFWITHRRLLLRIMIFYQIYCIFFIYFATPFYTPIFHTPFSRNAGIFWRRQTLFVYPTSTICIIEVYEYILFYDRIQESVFADTETIVSWMSDIWFHISSGFDGIFYDLIELLIKTQKKRLIAFLQEFYHGFRETIVVHYFDFDAMSLVRNSFPSTLSPFLYSSIAISNLLFFLVLLLVFMESPMR